jgi:hypothetical protein
VRRDHLWIQLALVPIICLIPVTVGAWAQPPIRVESSQHEAQFREQILFQLVAEGEAEIEEITFFYRVADQSTVNHASPEFDPGVRVEAEYTWDLTSGGLPPGVQVTYWWGIADGEGHAVESEPQSLLYIDERYDWHTLSSDKLALYWYRGDDDFGQALFDTAMESLDSLSQNAGVAVTHQVIVFIYGSHSDLLGAIAEGAKEWTGGQAFPDVGVVVIGVSPGNLAWGKRATAHELSHLVVHQVVDTPLGGLPRWLDEGLAMYTEGRLEPSYQRTLDQAIRDNGLITVRSLSSSFPADSELAHLSYAQSYSLVEFIIEEHGRERLAELLRVLAEGAHYDDALQEVLGLDSDGLDAAWRSWAGAKPQSEVESAPTSTPREPRPLRPALWSSVWLCCVGGLLSAVVIGLLLFLRQR